MALLRRCAGVAALLYGASGGEGIAEGGCWGGDFNEAMCCGERWGLTGNPVCWDEEFTYLRCCGLDAFPRRLERDERWDQQRRESAAEDAGEFDFIVVGAGSAGSVLAARLAAGFGPDGLPWRVLLLEEGPGAIPEERADPDELPSSPRLWRQPLQADWSLGGEDNRSWTYKTGRGLGGSARVNCMIYTRGSTSEYAAFGWSEDEVLSAFRALEAPLEAPGFPADPKFHRRVGDNEADVGPSGYDLTLVAATKDELPSFFRALVGAFEDASVPFRLDPHGASTIHGVGGTWRSMGCQHARCQPVRVSRFSFAQDRPRSTSYKALVAPLRGIGGHRLVVMPGSVVERIVFGPKGDAIAVEVSEDEVEDEDEGNIGARMAAPPHRPAATDIGKTKSKERPMRRKRYRVAREVILSAGVFGTPRILIHSGVGEPLELQRLGITVVAASPEVGRNLKEHVGVSIVASTLEPCPEGYHGDAEGKTSHLGNTAEFIGQIYAFLNATSNVPGSPGALDAEVMILEGCLEGHLSLTFTIILLQSRTRGRIAVQSRDPFTEPHLDYKPLSNSEDIGALADVVRFLYMRVFSAPGLIPYEMAVDPPVETVQDFNLLARWLRKALYYYSHPSGTCRISREGDPGVVDSTLRVQGVSRVRIADASVFPASPSGHFDAPSRLVGELASRFVLRDWSEREENLGEASEAGKVPGGPRVRLQGYRGVAMPLLGLGTNGYEGEKARSTVLHFLRLGGRLIDTALLYDNHRDIAAAIFSSGVPREEIFIVTKIPPRDMGFNEAAVAIDQSAAELGTTPDLLLIHWPANFQEDAPLPACAVPPGSWKACRIQTWRAMEEAYRQGKVRSLGVSNFGARHLSELLEESTRTLPVAANEVEFHPWWPQHNLRRLCERNRVQLIAYGSTGGSLMGGAMLRVPNVARVAASSGRSAAQVLLRWAVQQGVGVIPGSSSPAHIAENLAVSDDWELSKEEMDSVGAVSPEERMRVYLPDPEHAP